MIRLLVARVNFFLLRRIERHEILLITATTYVVYLPSFNPLNAELNPICHLLALLGAHHILHVSRIRVNGECTSYFRLWLYCSHLMQLHLQSCNDSLSELRWY